MTDQGGLAQGVLDLAEDTLIAVGDRGTEALRELGQELSLFVREVGWSDHATTDEEIAAAAAVEAGDALTLDGEDAAGLSAGRDFQGDGVAFESGDFGFEAERCLGGIHVQLVDDVVILAGEEGVGLDVDVDVEVAGVA